MRSIKSGFLEHRRLTGKRSVQQSTLSAAGSCSSPRAISTGQDVLSTIPGEGTAGSHTAAVLAANFIERVRDLAQ
jgi:hypothetical protein